MKPGVWLFLIFAVTPYCVGQQDCTSTVLVSFYDQLTKDEIQTLKTEDFEIKVDGKKFPVASSSRDFNNRLLILLETQGAAKNEHLDDIVTAVTAQARQAPEGEPVAFGIFAEKAIFTKGFYRNENRRTSAINEVMEEAGNWVSAWPSGKPCIRRSNSLACTSRVTQSWWSTDPYDDKSSISAESRGKRIRHERHTALHDAPHPPEPCGPGRFCMELARV